MRQSRPRILAATVAVAALLLTIVQLPAPSASASAVCTAGRTLNIVAHEDDDILFLNPDLLHDIQGGRCVRTLYVTAGDAGDPAWYWQSREEGMRQAYAQMIGVSGSWTQSDAGISGHPIPVFTHTGNDRVSLAFMRLPDGLSGNGSTTYGEQSLKKLWQNTDGTYSIGTVERPTPSSTYTRAQLISTLTALMASYAPDQIRTQNFHGQYDDDDHNDHYSTAYFVQAAKAGYSGGTLTGYYGYRTRFYPQNVFGSDATTKESVFYTYSAYDYRACDDAVACANDWYPHWFGRQYRINTTNVAQAATATASSQNASTLQTADKANDGAIEGSGVGNHEKEWATVGGGAGSWLRLTWPTARTIRTIVLYDRPNTNDQITGATLTFSSGSSVTVTALDNGGVGKIITLSAPRTVTWVQLTINSVASTTFNIGLAEVEVYPGTGP